MRADPLSPILPGGHSASTRTRSRCRPTEEQIRASPYGRVLTLARRLARGQPTQYDTVRAVQGYLRSEYAYSEQPPERRFPLAAFLFRDRIGYCQQFSGAMALMLRMLGDTRARAAGFTPGLVQRGHEGVPRSRPGRALVGRGVVQRHRLGAVRPHAVGRARPTCRRASTRHRRPRGRNRGQRGERPGGSERGSPRPAAARDRADQGNPELDGWMVPGRDPRARRRSLAVSAHPRASPPAAPDARGGARPRRAEAGARANRLVACTTGPHAPASSSGAWRAQPGRPRRGTPRMLRDRRFGAYGGPAPDVAARRGLRRALSLEAGDRGRGLRRMPRCLPVSFRRN